MRLFLLVLLLVFALGPGNARADQAEDIQGVINRQVEAFAAGDLAAAYSFAAPTIQSIFPSPEIFGRMVETGYPMIWRPAEVRYLGLRTEDGKTIQRMGFRDAAGRLHLFDYEMTEEDGVWRIAGVIPVREDVAV